MAFSPFCFFLHRCRALRCPQPFLRFANQLAHSAVRRFSPHLYEFFNQMSEGFLPEFRFCSTAETSVHRLIRRKVMRKLTPLTSGLYNVQHGVCQFALAYFRFRIPEYSSSIPFQWTSVKYVGYGLRPPFTSFAIIPRLLYEEKFLLCCPSFFAK